MDVRVIRNAASRTVRDDSAYYSLPAADGETFKKFKRDFLFPMRKNLSRSLRSLVSQGAGSMLEIGPGEGDGADIAIKEGVRSISMVEIRPSTVSALAKKYQRMSGDSELTIFQGDVRDTLPVTKPKSVDVGVVFDNTLSNMQEPKGPSGLGRKDFRAFVLSQLMRISRLSVLVGLSSTLLTPLYLDLGEGIIRETSPDGKISIFKSGIVTQRYDEADIVSLLTTLRAANFSVRMDRGIYWVEIKP